MNPNVHKRKLDREQVREKKKKKVYDAEEILEEVDEELKFLKEPSGYLSPIYL